jgi:nicotinamide mononucleotide (NMN) deamidase PncC
MFSMNTDLIELIQSSGYQAGIVVAGGGSGAVHALLSHPGASRFIMHVQIPYSREAMNEFLGEEPDSYCSEPAVRAMAERAFEEVQGFKVNRPLGIACSAALKTNEDRGDPDRAFICFYTSEKSKVYRIVFESESRKGQEDEICRTLIEQLAHFVADS